MTLPDDIILDRRDAVKVACLVLRGVGFVVVGRSARQNTFYLGLPGFQFQLRVSDHPKGAGAREQSPHTISNLTLKGGSVGSVERKARVVGRRFVRGLERLTGRR